MSDSIGIFIADDQADICSALRLLINEEPGFGVIGETADVVGLIEAVCEIPIDIILLDWELPGSGYFMDDVVKIVKRHQPGVRIIALSGHSGARAQAVSAGADSFVSKGDAPDILLAALRDIWDKIVKEG